MAEEQSPQHQRPPVSRFAPRQRTYLHVGKVTQEAPRPVALPTSDEVPAAQSLEINTLKETLADQSEAVNQYFELYGQAIMDYCMTRWGWAKRIYHNKTWKENDVGRHHALTVASETFRKAATTESVYRGNQEAMLPWLKAIAENVAKDLGKVARYHTAHLVPMDILAIVDKETGERTPWIDTVKDGASATDRLSDRLDAAERQQEDARIEDAADTIAKRAHLLGFTAKQANVLRLAALEIPALQIATLEAVPYSTVRRWITEGSRALGAQFKKYQRQ